MSRLIFEGNTTKRFGEKIPRPFIEEVRAYDNGVQVDIAFYFKVPNDDVSVAAFLTALKSGALSQSIVLSAITENTLNTLKTSKDFNVLSEMFLEQGSDLRDSRFAKRRAISFSDFINGNSTAPPNFTESLVRSAPLSFTGSSTPPAPFSLASTPSAPFSFASPQPETAAVYSSYNVAIKDDFYNQEGARFMKIFGTLPIDYNASGEMYVTCFVKND